MVSESIPGPAAGSGTSDVAAAAKREAANPGTIACGFGIAGGAVWALSALVGVDPLAAVGWLLVAVAAAAVGYSVVRTSPLWLRVVVCIAFPVLVLAVWQMVAQSLDALLGDGSGLLLGGSAALAAGGIGLLVRSRRAA